MEKDELEVMHSKWNMASYSTSGFINEFFAMAFSTYCFFYYETEIGLNVLLVGLGFVIYAIWNAIDDPFLAFLTDRPFSFTKKWGRRFPWIIIGGIPWIISYILIFTPPNVDPQAGSWILFTWLVFSTCLFDTFASIFFINVAALFPDKFRSVKERRIATGIDVVIGVFGTIFGAIIPPLLITFGDLQSYIIQGGAIAIICLVALAIAVPGCRDDQSAIDSYLAKHGEKKEQDSFFISMRNTLNQKAFLAYIMFYFLYQTMVKSMTGSIPYMVQFILKMEATAITLIMAGFLLGVLVSIPIWITLANKTNNNRKVMLFAIILIAIFTAPLIFIESYIAIIIAMFIWGMALGGVWAMIMPILSDIIDESIVLTQKRKEATFTGVQQFFSRLGIASQAISFAVVHSLTGFVEGSATQTPLALWGIHIHLAVVPIIAILLAAIIFWKLYDLTPERVAFNQKKVKELGF